MEEDRGKMEQMIRGRMRRKEKLSKRRRKEKLRVYISEGGKKLSSGAGVQTTGAEGR